MSNVISNYGLQTTVLECILLYNPDIPEFPWEFGAISTDGTTVPA